PPVSLPALSFEYLPRAGIRQAWKEFDRASRPIVGHLRSAKVKESFFRGRCASLEHHERFGILAPFVIRNRNYGHFIDAGMRCKSLFDFQRRNVLVPADDNIFLSYNFALLAILIYFSHILILYL